MTGRAYPPPRPRWHAIPVWAAAAIAVHAAFGAASALGAEPAASQPAAKDDLFSKVFGQKRQNRAQRLDLPVRLDGEEMGLVPAVLTGDILTATLNFATLAKLLDEVADPSALERLRAAAGEDGFGSPGDLPPDGIAVLVDEAALQVDVTVPPALRRVVKLEVQRLGELARGFMLLPPADLSAYINARAGLEYRSGDRLDGQKRRGPLGIAFEPAVNWRGWVLEGDLFYRENGYERWSRGAVRLVKDFPDSSVRLLAGDLAPPVDGLQTSRSLGGVSLFREFAIQPYRTTQPTGGRQFILDTPSTVEVYVNGRATRIYRLGAGPYDLSSLPGTSGANDVEIRITDSFGREQVVSFPFFFDSQLLAPGISEFAYTVGYPYTVDEDVLDYDTGRPVLSAYHRQGITDRLTLGAGLQADRDQQNLSAEMLFTTPYGTFAVEPGASFAGADGYALTARYRNYMRGDEVWRNRTVTAQVSWWDSLYIPFGVLSARNDARLDTSFRLSQPVTTDLVATLGARWRESRSPTIWDSHAVDLSLRYRLGLGDSLDVTLTHERDSRGDTSTGIFAALRFSFGDGRQSAGASIDTVRRERRLDWRYQSLTPVDSLALSVDALNRPGDNRLQGSADYTHQRFLAAVRHDLVEQAFGQEDGLDSRTQLNLATALAFADGHVGVSRPITNSFAIVLPHPRLDGRTVGVDPINGRYLAETDWLGPPVVPNISPYLIRPLLLDVPDVPLGYDIGNDRPGVAPGYRTGTLVPIGTDAAVSLDGTLIGQDGTPAALLSGVLRPVQGLEAEEVPFFTNRRGRFRVEAVRPGRWEMLVHGTEAPPIPFEVPPDAEGVINLGEVRLSLP